MPPSGRRDTFIGRTQHGLETVLILGQPNPGAARNRYVPDVSKAQQQLSLSVTIPWRKRYAAPAWLHKRLCLWMSQKGPRSQAEPCPWIRPTLKRPPARSDDHLC